MAKICFSLPVSLPLVLCFLCFLCFIKFTNSQTHPKDLAELHQIKNSLADIPSAVYTGFFSNWIFSSAVVDPCSSFSGVTCSNSRVTILVLGTGLSGSPGLVGSLSPAIARLTELTQLILFPGRVSGPIPPQLGSLRNLRVLSLTNNRLTGEIPVEIFGLANLHTLDLSHNRFTGGLPAAFPVLGGLKVLVLESNKLSGEMPRVFPQQLLHLDLSNNLFSGSLPPQMPLALRYLSAANNRMWGSLPGLDPLAELTFLDLSGNQFGGPIPGSLFRETVTSVLLQRNNFSGVVPQSPPWPHAAAGSTVDLSHNFLEGELTPALVGVEALFLNNNRLSGGVPKVYVESIEAGTMKTLYLQHNYITGFPMEVRSVLPETAAVCIAYNCISAPPVGLAACPASAGDMLCRPARQCPGFKQ